MTEHLTQNTDPRGVLTLTLNRPKVHNAFSDELIARMAEVFEQIDDDAAIRAVVITGVGESFSAGADLNSMRGSASASVEKSASAAGKNEEEALRLAQMLRRVNYSSKPTIARINGAAYGGGIGLLSCCDITISAAHAQFALTEARLGLAPAVISPYVFRRIGERNARRYFLNAQRFTAQRAQEIGLVQEVVAADELDEAVERQIELLLRAGPQAVKQCKKLVFLAANLDASRQRQLDQDNARMIARLRTSEEGQEGMNAFLQKRAPAWVSNNDN